MARKRLGFLLFDLPGDHEVESALSTECDTIASILHNRTLATRVKVIRAASESRLKKYPTYKYTVQFVHLACHGGPTGIGVLGGTLKWSEVVGVVKRHLKPLATGQKRVLCLSCCYSKAGLAAFKKGAADYFSLYYHFKADTIPFATAITTWAMFYLKKTLAKPHEGVRDAINEFHAKTFVA
ncbi:MAG: hypothetical protein ACKN9R_06070 [Candidatus Limnocylindrus sp.]